MKRYAVIIGTRFIVLSAWILLVIWLSLAKTPPAPDTSFIGADKLMHACAYFTMTILAGWAFSSKRPLSRFSWMLIIAAAMAIGGGLEVAQALFTETRQAEFGDFLANTMGASAAFFVFRVVRLPVRSNCMRSEGRDRE